MDKTDPSFYLSSQPYSVPLEATTNRPPISRVPDVDVVPESLEAYLVYTIEENNGIDRSWMAFKLHVTDEFNQEQRNHIYRSAKLMYAYRSPNNRRVVEIARNDSRDHGAYSFSGRPLRGRPAMTTDGLRDIIRRNDESVGINMTLYDGLYDWQRPFVYGKVTVNKFEENPTGNRWTLGRATVNRYSNNSQEYEISLNGLAIGSASAYSLSLDRLTWAATIQHEMIHNLGWRHQGNYDTAWMIAYETVAFPGSQFFLENCAVCNGDA